MLPINCGRQLKPPNWIPQNKNNKIVFFTDSYRNEWGSLFLLTHSALNSLKGTDRALQAVEVTFILTRNISIHGLSKSNRKNKRTEIGWIFEEQGGGLSSVERNTFLP